MGLASIANVPRSREELLAWSFNHMAHHRDVQRRIYQVFRIALAEYPLDPMNPDDLGVWSYQHQTMHNNTNAVLGTVGTNLLDVNWQDEAERAEWVFLDMAEHLAWNQKLGV